MAVFNEIDEGGLNGILTRRLGMPGGSPAPSLAPEIMPDMTLENDRPEWGWLKGEMHCSGNVLVAAVALNHGVVEFVNPTGSNTIATFTRFDNCGGNDLWISRAALSTAVCTTLVYSGVSDTRFTFRTYQTQIKTGANPVYPSNQGIFAFLGGNPHLFDAPLILTPGQMFRVYGDSTNSPLHFNFSFYERIAQSGELV